MAERGGRPYAPPTGIRWVKRTDRMQVSDPQRGAAASRFRRGSRTRPGVAAQLGLHHPHRHPLRHRSAPPLARACHRGAQEFVVTAQYAPRRWTRPCSA